jgi:hypothetical protein
MRSARIFPRGPPAILLPFVFESSAGSIESDTARERKRVALCRRMDLADLARLTEESGEET